jgi:hypothetical protein
MNKQTVTMEERERAMGIVGLVQCEGCPSGVLVVPARPGHADDCRECSRHCMCFKDTMGSGWR